MACVDTLKTYIAGPSGLTYRLGIDDNGVLSTVREDGPASQIVMPAGSRLGGAPYVLKVDAEEFLVTEPTNFPVTFLQKMLASATPTYWWLKLARDGQLYPEETSSPFPADPVVGQLMGVYEAFPTPSQPGGAGTAVTAPTQAVGNETGLFQPGCGHKITRYEVRKHLVGCQLSALLVCPLCSYLQRIITPYEDLNLPANALLIA